MEETTAHTRMAPVLSPKLKLQPLPEAKSAEALEPRRQPHSRRVICSYDQRTRDSRNSLLLRQTLPLLPPVTMAPKTVTKPVADQRAEEPHGYEFGGPYASPLLHYTVPHFTTH